MTEEPGKFRPYPKSSSTRHAERDPKPKKIKMTAAQFQQKYGSKIGTKSVLATPKARKPIKKISERRKGENAEYSKKRKEFLETRMKCECEDCNNMSTEIHHKAGRSGEMLNDETKWLAVCRSCHAFIETHVEWAKEHGYSLDRLSISNNRS